MPKDSRAANPEALSNNIAFLSSYHNAKLTEFTHIISSECNLDTKSNAILAADLAILTIIITFNKNVTEFTFLAVLSIFVSIAVSMVSVWIKFHRGPVAQASFKDDLAPGKEAQILQQLIEDTDAYSNENLDFLKKKANLYKLQASLLAAAVTLVMLEWIKTLII